MLERKTLAYGDGKAVRPKMFKRLVFAGTLLVSMGACTPAVAVPIPDRPRLEAPRVEPPRMPERRACAPQADVILQPNERVRGSRCLGSRDFVLTDMNLFVIDRRAAGLSLPVEGNIDLRYSYSRTDMRGVLSRGLVDWEASEDTVFFLTRDRILTLIPNERMGDTVPSYEMPFETAGLGANRMMFWRGFLMVAPLSGDVLVMEFANGADARYVPTGVQPAAAGFSIRDHRLFFGARGQEVEIRISGPTVNDVGPVFR
jgi:hypothetical protein